MLDGKTLLPSHLWTNYSANQTWLVPVHPECQETSQVTLHCTCAITGFLIMFPWQQYSGHSKQAMWLRCSPCTALFSLLLWTKSTFPNVKLRPLDLVQQKHEGARNSEHAGTLLLGKLLKDLKTPAIITIDSVSLWEEKTRNPCWRK